MTQETIEPSQRAREAASDIARYGSPGLGNGNTIVAAEIKGGLHDDYALAQAFARFERSILSEHDSRVKELVKAAWFDGHAIGRCGGELMTVDDDWARSETLAALNGGSDAE